MGDARYRMSCGPSRPLFGWTNRRSLRAALSAARRALEWSGVDWVTITDTRTGKVWRLPQPAEE